MLKLYIILILSFIASNVFAGNTYYLTTAGAGAAQTPGNWSPVGTGGGGTVATNFNGSGDVFIISSGQTAVFAAGTTTTFASGATLQVEGTFTVGAASNTTTNLTINGIIIFTSTATTATVNVATGGGSNSFTLGSSATLKTANITGISGASCSLPATVTKGVVSLSTSANYEFNGVANQATLGLPATVTSLTINNTGIAGTNIVTLNAGVTVTNFTLTTGVFDPKTFLVTATTPTFTAGTLRVGQTTWAGNYSFSVTEPAAGVIEYNASGPQTVNNVSLGGSLLLSGSGAKTLQTGMTSIGGNLTFSGTATATGVVGITIGGFVILGSGTTFTGGAFTHNIGGDWTNNGATFTNTGTTVNMNGTVAQAIGGSSSTTFNNLTISNTSATVSVNTNMNVNGTLNMNGTNTTLAPAATVVINNAAPAGIISGTGIIQVSRIAATADYVNQYKFSTNTLTSLTVNYTGAGAQTINNTVGNYGALIVGGSGTKTLAGNIIVNGQLTLSAGTLDVSASNYSLTVGGNWTNNGGTFSAGTGTVTFNGTGAQIINGTASAETFYNLVISKTAGQYLSTGGSVTTLTAQNITQTTGDFNAPATLNISGDITLTSETFTAGTNINISGNWSQASAAIFTAGSNTVNFTGTGAQSISGTATSITFYNVVIAKTAGQTLSAGISTMSTHDLTQTTGNFTAPATLNINGNLILTTGTFTAGTTTNITGNWSHATGATFTPGTNTVNFTGTGAQTINGTSAFEVFYNVVIAKTAGQLLNTGGSIVTLTTQNFTQTTGNFAAPATFNVNGDILLSAGTFTANTNLNIAGNFTNNGTTFTAGSNNVTFNGSNGLQIISGIAATAFYNVIINKGTDATKVAEVNGAATISNTNNLTLTNGVLKLTTGSFKFNAAAAIPATAGLFVNGGSFTTGSNTVTNNGLVKVVSGSAVFGTSINKGLINQNNALVDISGGTTSIGGRLENSASGSAPAGYSSTGVSISGGTLTLSTAGSTDNSLGTFNMAASSNLSVTGGTIVFREPASFFDLDIYAGGNKSITGGTIQIGDAITTAFPQFDIHSEIPVYNFTINAANSPLALLTNDLTVTNNITISGGTLDASASDYNISIGAIWTNNGTFTARNGTVTFNGTSAQTLGGSAATTFNNFTINNTSGITVAASPVINNVLTFTNGIFTTNSNNITLGNLATISGAGAGKYVDGNLKRFIPSGASSATFDIGESGNYLPVTLTFNGTISSGTGSINIKTLSGDHAQLASSGINTAKSINRTWTITNPSAIAGLTSYNATFTFAPGDKDAGVDPNNFVIRKYVSSAWSTTTTGTKNPLNTQSTSVSAFRDFAIGEANSLDVSVQPNNEIVCSGQNITFTAASSSDPMPTIQWQRSTDGIAAYTDITANLDAATVYSNFNSGTLVLTGTSTMMNNYHYRAAFTNINGTVYSDPATLTINTPAAITLQPTDQTGCSATFTATATDVSTYQWQESTNGVLWNDINNGGIYSGATSNTLSISSTATVANNKYRLKLTGTTPCGIVTSNEVTIHPQYLWTGALNTDWNNTANWCSGVVPDASDAVVTIPAVTNLPVISSGTFRVQDITIDASASLTNNGMLKISGSIIRNGTFTTTSGTISFNGTGAQTINSNMFSSATLAGLVIDKISGTATLAGSITITDSLTVAAGTFDADHKSITLHSDADNTARVGIIGGSILNADSVTVERYLSSLNNRAYRMITPSVNTTTSIHANWQEGATARGDNPHPGYGTHITGTSIDQANGFDATQTAQASLFLLQNNAWTGISNTNVNTLNATQAYLLFVRGDRSYNLDQPQTTQFISQNTTLRATGTLLTGTQTFSNLPVNASSVKVSLVTNPYASPLDWKKVYDDNNTSFLNYYTYWDPNYGTRGGYITVTDLGLTSPASSATTSIQSGEAFYVTAPAGLTPVTLTIKEAHKATANNLDVFKPAKQQPQIRASLYFNSTELGRRIADGALAAFDDGYSAGIDKNDAYQIQNFDEDVSFQRAGSRLSIETRPLVISSDTLFLYLANMKVQQYEWQFEPENFINMSAMLVDNFTGTITNLTNGSNTIVPFSITSNAASKATNRFYIILHPSTALPVTFIDLSAVKKSNGVQLVWHTVNEINPASYEVERSQNGISFYILKSVSSDNKSVYTWNDVSPLAGVNFYRIKAIDINHKTTFTNTVKINSANVAGMITVAPNPVINQILNLQFSDVAGSSYTIHLINTAGQEVYRSVISHTAASASYTLKLPAISHGIYNLRAEDTNGNIINTEVIIK